MSNETTMPEYSIADFWGPQLTSPAEPLKLPNADHGWFTSADKDENAIKAHEKMPVKSGFGIRELFHRKEPAILVHTFENTTFGYALEEGTDAILVDLAKSGCIGEHFLTGGLAWLDLLDEVKDGKLGLIVHDLDRGRQKVLPGGLIGLMEDIKSLQSRRSFPIVVTAQDASLLETVWMWFKRDDIHLPMLEENLTPY